MTTQNEKQRMPYMQPSPFVSCTNFLSRILNKLDEFPILQFKQHHQMGFVFTEHNHRHTAADRADLLAVAFLHPEKIIFVEPFPQVSDNLIGLVLCKAGERLLLVLRQVCESNRVVICTGYIVKLFCAGPCFLQIRVGFNIQLSFRSPFCLCLWLLERREGSSL